MTFDPAVNRETGASGRRYHFDMWTGWIRCRCDAHKKQVYVKQLYNPVAQTDSVSWSQLVGVRVAVRGSENQLPAEGLGPQDLRLSSPTEWERSAVIVRGTWGQYVAVFRIMCERYIFLKKCVRSSSLLIVSAYICIRIVVSRLYNSVVQFERCWECVVISQLP